MRINTNVAAKGGKWAEMSLLYSYYSTHVHNMMSWSPAQILDPLVSVKSTFQTLTHLSVAFLNQHINSELPTTILKKYSVKKWPTFVSIILLLFKSTFCNLIWTNFIGSPVCMVTFLSRYQPPKITIRQIHCYLLLCLLSLSWFESYLGLCLLTLSFS